MEVQDWPIMVLVALTSWESNTMNIIMDWGMGLSCCLWTPLYYPPTNIGVTKHALINYKLPL